MTDLRNDLGKRLNLNVCFVSKANMRSDSYESPLTANDRDALSDCNGRKADMGDGRSQCLLSTHNGHWGRQRSAFRDNLVRATPTFDDKFEQKL